MSVQTWGIYLFKKENSPNLYFLAKRLKPSTNKTLQLYQTDRLTPIFLSDSRTDLRPLLEKTGFSNHHNHKKTPKSKSGKPSSIKTKNPTIFLGFFFPKINEPISKVVWYINIIRNKQQLNIKQVPRMWKPSKESVWVYEVQELLQEPRVSLPNTCQEHLGSCCQTPSIFKASKSTTAAVFSHYWSRSSTGAAWSASTSGKP